MEQNNDLIEKIFPRKDSVTTDIKRLILFTNGEKEKTVMIYKIYDCYLTNNDGLVACIAGDTKVGAVKLDNDGDISDMNSVIKDKIGG